jgi:hypothetical protein
VDADVGIQLFVKVEEDLDVLRISETGTGSFAGVLELPQSFCFGIAWSETLLRPL